MSTTDGMARFAGYGVAAGRNNPLLPACGGSGADAVLGGATTHGDRLLSLEAAVAGLRRLCARRLDEVKQHHVATGCVFPPLISVAAVQAILDEYGVGR